MQNKIKAFMDEWQYNDETLVNFSNGDKESLKDRQYQKEKLRKTAAFIRENRRKKLSKEEKAWLIILKTGNRHRERKLYPNRFVRYTRRAFGTLKRAAAQLPRQLNRISEPTPDLMDYNRTREMPLKTKPDRNAQIKSVVKATVLKLPAKNKYAAAKGARQSKGRSL